MLQTLHFLALNTSGLVIAIRKIRQNELKKKNPLTFKVKTLGSDSVRYRKLYSDRISPKILNAIEIFNHA